MSSSSSSIRMAGPVVRLQRAFLVWITLAPPSDGGAAQTRETLQVYTVLGYFIPRDAPPKVTLQTLSKLPTFRQIVFVL